MNSIDLDIYSFFKDFKNYKSYEDRIDGNFKRDGYKNTCFYFPLDVKISNTESANQICEKFKSFYTFIISINKKTNTLSNKDLSYLNYWLNSKLRNAMYSHNISVETFHYKMNHIEGDLAGYDIFAGKLYNISDVDFENMKLLDYLYVNHGIIFKIISEENEENISCLQHFQELIDNYKKGIIQCSIDNSDFCKALRDFKEEYEKDFIREYRITEKCIDQEFLKLPTYYDVSQENKITVVGSITGPIFGTLFALLCFYKFTPFGQWILAKIRTNKEAHSISYEENDKLFLDTSDNGHINPDYNLYHIPYDSVVNP
ncbi:Plasmodium vivax Vir protein, putative [Plasmodium ovale]|uniref:Plasmodium vivax Vir protein, putative n=1 Tax=Plasmodium ovale TaxID=36330 RepID=A0A1C3KWK1_PLAOA|nr:Plasmodium vivax Vir protein, putative [Plasmodium ovale]